MHVHHDEGRAAFLDQLTVFAAVADGLSDNDLMAASGGALPGDWSDERVLLLGSGRIEPDDRDRAVAAGLPVLG
jgi:hypothetical protein